MTIDERIEALTQSVELLASFHRDSEVRNLENEARDRESEARYEARFSNVMDVLERLTLVADKHEHRIERLEDKH